MPITPPDNWLHLRNLTGLGPRLFLMIQRFAAPFSTENPPGDIHHCFVKGIEGFVFSINGHAG